MLNSLSDYIKEMPGRSFMRYHQYMNNLEAFYTRHYLRLRLAYGYEHRGIALLRQVLNNVDYEWCFKTNDDVAIYQNHLRFIKRDVDNIFSMVTSGRNFKHHFLNKRAGDVPEYLIPVEDTNTLSYLPFTERWNKWEEVRPMRIWYHDSPEFTVNMLHDKVHFANTAPSYCIVLIDTVALCMKYYKWLREGKEFESIPDIDLTQQFFLHKHVICPMMKDLIDIWCLHNVQYAIDTSNISDYVDDELNTDKHESQYGYVGVRYADMIQALHVELHNVKKGQLYPNAFINSKVLFTGSLYDRFQTTLNRWAVPNLRQYEYLTILKDMPLLRILLDIHHLNPELPAYKNLIRESRWQYGRMLKRRPWNNCHNPKLRTYIENKVTSYGDEYLM